MHQLNSEREVPLTAKVEDILPIIKRFMHSKPDIFLRELIANAIDALEKLSKMVLLDPVRATIVISDNGIRMSSDEVTKYINQIAFSGAKEFLERYRENENKLDYATYPIFP